MCDCCGKPSEILPMADAHDDHGHCHGHDHHHHHGHDHHHDHDHPHDHSHDHHHHGPVVTVIEAAPKSAK